MENRVTGANAPMSLGELRQAICATTFGNPLFTPEEQLTYNHLAHESEDAEHLAQFLRATRREDVDRNRLHRGLQAQAISYPGVCQDESTHLAEMRSLLLCKPLDNDTKAIMVSMMSSVASKAGDRVKFLGYAYQYLLEDLGYMHRKRGYEALKDN